MDLMTGERTVATTNAEVHVHHEHVCAVDDAGHIGGRRLGIAVVGALIDAGMSLYQVTWAERGLSFRSDAPLDMRYDPTKGITARELIATEFAVQAGKCVFEL